MKRAFMRGLFAALILLAGQGAANASVFNPETAVLSNGMEVIVVTKPARAGRYAHGLVQGRVHRRTPRPFRYCAFP